MFSMLENATWAHSMPQRILDELRVSDELIETHWVSAKNGWVRALPNKKVGRVGELLAQRLLGGTLHTDNSTGYDLECGSMKIEVKTSTLSFTGSNVWTWNQVRPNDPYSHLCFVAIYPDKVRVFNVPKSDIPQAVLWPQHGIGGDGGTTTQIKWGQRDSFPPWMECCEVHWKAGA
jgi:hypothetical protein